MAVFKWMAAITVDINQVNGKEGLMPVLKFFVPPLTREINDDGAPEEVKNLAQEVAELIKGFFSFLSSSLLLHFVLTIH